MERVENDIALLGRAMIFPDTPSMAARVRARIGAPNFGRAPSSRWQLALTGVAAAVVAVPISSTASTSSRSTKSRRIPRVT
jgi:hypothetical protein